MDTHSESNEELKQRIYEANSLTHDTYAASHDRAVPYIYRRSVRAFYWRLLCELAGNQVWQNADVLELGCGTGTFTDHILARNPRSFTGLDLSVQMLEQARRKFPDPRCLWVRAPLELFSSAAKSHFDVIFSFSFLHHLPDLPAGLSQIRSLLKPEGVYVGLHEIILPKQKSFLEKLDEKLEFVFGSAVNAKDNFWRRLWQALPGKLTGRRGGEAASAQDNPEPDYVDYQLNKDFDLQKIAAPGARVVGYSYLNFPWLGILGRPINHRALVMRCC